MKKEAVLKRTDARRRVFEAVYVIGSEIVDLERFKTAKNRDKAVSAYRQLILSAI